jgi:SAM-dependent methyltransferase
VSLLHSYGKFDTSPAKEDALHIQLVNDQMTKTDRPAISLDDLTLLLFGHAAFQYLHAGSAFRIFHLLADSPGGMTAEELRARTGLAPHPMRCLLFGLSSLRLVTKSAERYINAPLVADLIATGQWSVIEDTIALEADVVYLGQADFVESLRQNSNVGLRRIPGIGRDLYHRLGENPELQTVFYKYMRSWSVMACSFLLKNVAFGQWSQIVDVGGGDGTNAIAIAQANPAVTVTVLDLPGNGAVLKARVGEAGLGARLRIVEGDMFGEPFPRDSDCFLFMHQLVIWPLETVGLLLQKAYEALRPGGAVVICSSISDDSQEGPLMAALDSVYFVSIPATRGMIYSWGDYEAALSTAGFQRIERHPFGNWTPHGALVAFKGN